VAFSVGSTSMLANPSGLSKSLASVWFGVSSVNGPKRGISNGFNMVFNVNLLR
jgi:hypothetical protein